MRATVRTFFSLGHPFGEWSISLVLKLADSGTFTLTEEWTSYAAASGDSATGRWTESGTSLGLSVEHSTLSQYPAGAHLTCTRTDEGWQLVETTLFAMERRRG